MKVTEIKSFQIAGDDGRGYFVVKVETDAGLHGLGEAGIRFWGSAIGKAVEHLSELVVGQDPFSTERLWQHMFRGSFFPADGVYSCAISAIDIALWDIKGKALNMPVYKLLGGPVRDKVVCYPHNQGEDIAGLVESCRRAVDEGWRFVRWGSRGPGVALMRRRMRDAWSRWSPYASPWSRWRGCARPWDPTSRSASMCTPGWTPPTSYRCAGSLSRISPSS